MFWSAFDLEIQKQHKTDGAWWDSWALQGHTCFWFFTRWHHCLCLKKCWFSRSSIKQWKSWFDGDLLSFSYGFQSDSLGFLGSRRGDKTLWRPTKMSAACNWYDLTFNNDEGQESDARDKEAEPNQEGDPKVPDEQKLQEEVMVNGATHVRCDYCVFHNSTYGGWKGTPCDFCPRKLRRERMKYRILEILRANDPDEMQRQAEARRHVYMRMILPSYIDANFQYQQWCLPDWGPQQWPHMVLFGFEVCLVRDFEDLLDFLPHLVVGSLSIRGKFDVCCWLSCTWGIAPPLYSLWRMRLQRSTEWVMRWIAVFQQKYFYRVK